MAKNKLIYYKLDTFENFISRMIRREQDFEISSTTYTKKIRNGHYNLMFNQDGKSDFDILSLINKVRKDGKNMISKTMLDEENHGIKFFDIFEIPDPNEKLYKIDIKSAYWNYALKLGVISQDTNNFLTQKFGNLPKDRFKEIRLKALGSLATKKIIETYEKGIIKDRSIKVEDTRPVYMNVCKGIDDIMRLCSQEIEGCVYYYWDCVFTKQGAADKVMEFFKDINFEVTVERTNLRYVKLTNKNGILLSDDNKHYKLRREDSQLIESVYKEDQEKIERDLFEFDRKDRKTWYNQY